MLVMEQQSPSLASSPSKKQQIQSARSVFEANIRKNNENGGGSSSNSFLTNLASSSSSPTKTPLVRRQQRRTSLGMSTIEEMERELDMIVNNGDDDLGLSSTPTSSPPQRQRQHRPACAPMTCPAPRSKSMFTKMPMSRLPFSDPSESSAADADPATLVEYSRQGLAATQKQSRPQSTGGGNKSIMEVLDQYEEFLNDECADQSSSTETGYLKSSDATASTTSAHSDDESKDETSNHNSPQKNKVKMFQQPADEASSSSPSKQQGRRQNSFRLSSPRVGKQNSFRLLTPMPSMTPRTRRQRSFRLPGRLSVNL